MIVLTRHEFATRVKMAGIKPRLRRILRYVPEEIITPEQRDFLAVTDKSGSEGVLIYGEQTVSFELVPRAAKSSGSVAAIICDICATWRRGPESATIAFAKSARTTVSYLVCADLDCSLHVRALTNAGVVSRSQIREDITPEKRVVRLTTRLDAILDGLGN